MTEPTPAPLTGGTDSQGIRPQPDPTVARIPLDGTSWVDVSRGWLPEADAGRLFGALLEGVSWQAGRLFRYDHWVEERRLGSYWQPGRPLPHPALGGITRALQQRYRVQFAGFGLIQYRHGGDGQGFHRDTDLRWLEDTVIAVLTLGARRPWLLRPKASRHDLSETRGATHDLEPGAGDLLVMGGRSQADWEHSVPYLPHEPVGVRISLQWRYTSRRGRPFAGGPYRAPLSYGGRH